MTDMDKDQAWLNSVRQELDAAARDLDAATLSRLNRARQAALCEVGRKRRPLLFWMPGLVAAMGLTLAIGLWLRPGSETQVPELSDPAQDFAMLANPDDLKMYDDLEFYAWLDSQQSSSDPWSDWDPGT